MRFHPEKNFSSRSDRIIYRIGAILAAGGVLSALQGGHTWYEADGVRSDMVNNCSVYGYPGPPECAQLEDYKVASDNAYALFKSEATLAFLGVAMAGMVYAKNKQNLEEGQLAPEVDKLDEELQLYRENKNAFPEAPKGIFE